MPITEKQRKWRQSHVGSSDAPALFGRDPFKTATNVYYEKVLTVEGEGSKPVHTKLGHGLEDAVLDWYVQQTGSKIVRNQQRVAQDGVLSASHDALAPDRCVEAKTSGILFMAPDRDEWGEPGTDQVPDRVVIQCQQQMYVSDLDRVDVPALLGGRGFILFSVLRDDELIEMIRERGLRFWEENVTKRIPPTDEPPPVQLLRRLRRVPNKIVPVDPDLVKDWLAAKELARRYRKAAEEHDARVLQALQDAECGDAGYGHVTAYEVARRGYEVKPTTYRQLRFKEHKDAQTGIIDPT